MKWRREMRAALIVALALVTSGCGYALAGRGTFLPDYIRVVGIPPIENRSTYQQVELVLTEKIRTEFIGRGKYTVLPEASGSDAVLTGEITGISAQPIGFNESQLASRYLFTMTMRVQLTDARTNMVLWSNDALSFREESDLTTRGATVLQGADFIDQERSSFDRIASDVARTVVTAILEAF
jgi:hypothetical protein